MSINSQKSRERIKRSILTGVIPTAKAPGDFTDGTWLNTDIRPGELFFNIPDKRLWIGYNSGILELSNTSNTLSSILTNGNATLAGQIMTGLSTLSSLALDFAGNNGKVFLGDTISYFKTDTTNTTIAGNNLILSNSNLFKLSGTFNGTSITDVIIFKDNYLSSLTSTSSMCPSVIISSKSSTVSIGTYNCVILAGVNNTVSGAYNIVGCAFNTITSGSNNTVSGLQNTNTSGNCNIISGSYNTITSGDYNTVSGLQNTNTSGGCNIISGSYNTNNISSDGNIISGVGNTNTSGSYNNVICGGSNTITNSANNSISGDTNTVTSGGSNTVSGNTNTVSGGGANIVGGQANNISSNYSIVGGRNNNINSINDSIVGGMGNTLDNNGIIFGSAMYDATTSIGSSGFSVMGLTTTNATTSLLSLYGNFNSTIFLIPTNVAYRVNLTAIATNTATGACKEWSGFGIIKNVAGTVSFVGGGITMTSTISDDALSTTTIVVAANTTTHSLDFRVTGIAATNINWICTIKYEKIII
jgi:hypothetical protein